MSDDGGSYDDASAGPTGSSHGGGIPPSWSVLRRAMRWETLALVVLFVVVAALAS
ncbi:hypothetical protein [Streptomyces sp. NPDC020742]|uniref:hypothetical protein n=1 Tax=unclassified Streptomyces TaxID=2593676 RepID=UPI0033EF3C3C